MLYGYWFSKVNYKREKKSDGSVTVTRTPEFDGDGLTMATTLLVLLPLMAFILGVTAICFCGITFAWGAIPTIWNIALKATIGAFIVACFLFIPLCIAVKE